MNGDEEIDKIPGVQYTFWHFSMCPFKYQFCRDDLGIKRLFIAIDFFGSIFHWNHHAWLLNGSKRSWNLNFMCAQDLVFLRFPSVKVQIMTRKWQKLQWCAGLFLHEISIRSIFLLLTSSVFYLYLANKFSFFDELFLCDFFPVKRFLFTILKILLWEN